MAQPEKITEISEVQGTQSTKQVQSTTEVEGTERASPNKEKFDELVQQKPAPQPVQQTEGVNKPSPMEVSGTQQTERVRSVGETSLIDSIDNNVKRYEEAKSKLESAKTELETSGLQLPSSYRDLMEGHLTHANENVKIALTSVGQEGTAPTAPAGGGGGALERFFGMLTDGQHNLMQLSSSMSGGDASGAFSPGQVLAVQIKMNSVTQQLEFFTSALSKALESVKTIMNIQV